MTEHTLAEVGRVLARRVGLRLDPAIRGRLARALRDEAARVGEDEATYVTRLESDHDRLQHLVNRVTVQETSFFRDAGQFDALATHVLPRLAERGARVLVWSAGCANGQEPYSLAMTLAESAVADWHVIASDVSTAALARTRAGRYRTRELRGLSDERRTRHLTPIGDGEWEVAAALRDNVTVVRHNLAVDQPPFAAGDCQIVFCRNVLIYFGHDELVAFLQRLAARLAPTGHLFLGYSESLWQVTDLFRLEHVGDAFVYRPGGVAPAPAVPLRPEPLRRAPVPVPPVTGGRPPAPAPAPAPAEQAPTEQAPTEPVPSATDLLAEGEVALDGGDHITAVAAFRKAAFIDPDHPLAHFSLGLALEMGGDAVAAKRAYTAARAALERCDAAALEAVLEGYRVEDLTSLLTYKIAAS